MTTKVNIDTPVVETCSDDELVKDLEDRGYIVSCKRLGGYRE